MLTELKRRITKNSAQRRSVSEEIRRISDAIEIADAAFNEVSDGDLIDALIYERSALRARYSFLIKELRRLDAPSRSEG